MPGRAGDLRALELLRRVAELASPTGHWPEAIHPLTGGGCMGDGHHAWAAAEWIAMVRSLFLIEEVDGLVLVPGLDPEWLKAGQGISFGPAPTRFGAVRVSVDPTARGAGGVLVRWEGEWRGTCPPIEVRPPGFAPVSARPDQGSVGLERAPVET